MVDKLIQFGHWLQQHDVTVDLITVWALTLGFLLFAVTKAVSWWTLRSATDATMIGVTLKRQKLVESIIGLGMSTLYGMTLISYYMQSPVFGFWDRLLLRGGLFLAMVLGSVYSVQFVYHLRRASRSDAEGAIPLANESEGA